MPKWTSICSIFLLAACSGDAVVEPRSLLGSRGSVAASHGAEREFPVVHIMSGRVPPSHADAPVVDNFPDALAWVQPRGRIKVHPGMYMAASVRVEKSVTIEAVGGGTPVINADGAPSALEIVPGAGAIFIRGLQFRNTSGAAVVIALPVDEVLIEDARFYSGRTDPGDEETILAVAIRGGSDSAPEAIQPQITIRNSTFVGGDGGISAMFSGGGTVTVLGSTFREQTDFSVVAAFGGTLRVEGNTIENCGWLVCVGTDRLAEAWVRDNRVTVSKDRPLFNPARGHGSDVFGIAARTAVIENNTIAGELGAATPSGYSISRNAIHLGLEWHRTGATVTGNRISNAYGGIWLGNADVTGSDNVIRRVQIAFGGFASGPPPAGSTNRAALHRNDVTEYGSALDPGQGFLAFSAADFSCNWWGSADGPYIQPGAAWPPTVYTPWATESIANRPAVECPA